MGIFAGFGSSGEELVRSADSSLVISFLHAQSQVASERTQSPLNVSFILFVFSEKKKLYFSYSP